MNQFKAIPSDHMSPELGTENTQQEFSHASWHAPATPV